MLIETKAARGPRIDVLPDDEAYWLEIRARMKPMYVNTQLVNSRRGAAPIEVRDRIRSLVDLALSYELDEYEPFRDLKESGSSVLIRQLLADYFGSSLEEIALTRNAMEGIATVLNGFPLQAGDEILATRFCYDSNLAIIRQRVAREGQVLKFVELPFGIADDAQIIEAFDRAMTSRTKLISMPHVVARTGLVLPIAEISRLASSRNVFTLVDGAHSAGHFPFQLKELGCDAFATCLHKWVYGPRGTGFIHIKHDRISDVWPLFASWSNKPATSIEKFEEVGTVFKALQASIPDAISFNLEIGQEAKSARLRYLRDRWAQPLREHRRVQMLTNIDIRPGTGFGAFTIDGMDNREFARILLEEFTINVSAFAMEEDASMSGIHLSPGLPNSVEEVDRFVAAAVSILDR
ncbi:MAG: aminotransferase class V-fold PLP-dependent enzyme [Mesorhizobium sp.]|uniref:aminotransferase class V-fold PLP-dependent enzyme n=1 Tax=Mesorhizobium sp. TaxID=1871066 RepID=UPI000FE723A2|nr:aminotransferase class V-fold PLP-dependent enzyme [Mesorhizobium sp.]RWH82137.1 MAG: aminotransferase class V-fold PLP-dependent enzyme [Mesorhizobium sp.]RWH85138.1 MAG: aminotransferase class V-fold PLP-dependent enzyme [Mesorhizobium sp.]RWH89893.1 MAG: aminotransferase class V-fold PLP-dependent enzyme [Mesorhizobium sp.]RWH98358.1 MAG: aminotransferase class V-fold PLP-dependent enzyme [Mesorhizobium sp.]RWI04635.1 MAG: aminotransferase class V-fold PLP-dependent enzyme [Mesorhizobium